ncbi:hypothetical protein CKO44_21040 [Rubrivivax gelatinosus]|uniref:Uncharacterized protein n=1 Tax=Rubrivivax gelatinosus TaxID=28068 RepID=A0ABS1DPJ9_RUBGE|nr:hypothetical protein [Rubrivivax gelatinosus]MBK1615943.1 hypothetical protein [Rubrivivax gelatinosus]MBK1711897.1 hypothetical protein [Rubrivivax gelatinosus]
MSRRALTLLRPWWVVSVLLLGWAALAEWHESRPAEPAAAVVDAGWGHEVLQAADDERSADRFSPLGVANACGLGASSCFKCHNGVRAAAPAADAAKGPWHRDHAKVNYSCVGCHQGNPRLLKQDLAHARLVANPLQSEAACSACHQTGTPAQWRAPYLRTAAPSAPKS